MKLQKVNRILICVSFVRPIISGDGDSAMVFSTELVKQGCKVTIVSLNPRNSLKVKMTVKEVQIYRTPYYNFSLFGKIISRLFFIPIAFYRILCADTIVVYGRMLSYSFVLFSSIILRKKVVFRSTLMNFDDPISLAKGKGITKRFNYFLLRRISLYYATTPTFLERWTNLGLSVNKVFLSPQGVDLELFNPTSSDEKRELRKRLNLPLNSKIICSIGDLCYRKGYNEIAKALEALDAPYLYIVLGIKEADSSLWGQKKNTIEISIIREALKVGVKDKLELVGIVNNPQDYLKASDIFLHYSFSEGLSNAMLQAMACGLPMVVKPIEGLTDYILHENDNCLFANKWCEITEKINILFANSTFSETLGSNAHKLSLEKFCISNVANNFISSVNE